MFPTLQMNYEKTFWHGDDLVCMSRDEVDFRQFPSLTIALAASANETMRLVVSPWQYLRLVSDRERYIGLYNTDPQFDCFRLSISSSDTGMLASYCLPSSSLYVWFSQVLDYSDMWVDCVKPQLGIKPISETKAAEEMINTVLCV